jgi:hypothetical protein
LIHEEALPQHQARGGLLHVRTISGPDAGVEGCVTHHPWDLTGAAEDAGAIGACTRLPHIPGRHTGPDRSRRRRCRGSRSLAEASIALALRPAEPPGLTGRRGTDRDLTAPVELDPPKTKRSRSWTNLIPVLEEEEPEELEPLPDVVGSTGPPVEEKPPLSWHEVEELEPDSVATPSGGQAQSRKGIRKSFRMAVGYVADTNTYWRQACASLGAKVVLDPHRPPAPKTRVFC